MINKIRIGDLLNKEFVSGLVFIFLASILHADFNTTDQAQTVLGQNTFTTDFPDRANEHAYSDSLWYPRDLTVCGNRMFVADNLNHRILRYSRANAGDSFSSAADLVLGQTSLDLNIKPTAPSKTSVSYPTGIHCDGSNLIMADGGYHRILIWNNVDALSNNKEANVVLGQNSFTTKSSGSSANQMYDPHGVWVAGGKLFVADGNNHRILIWNSTSTLTNGKPADVILGGPTAGTSHTLFNTPQNVFSDGTCLLVSDWKNNRVLYWATIPVTSNTPADKVLGQDDFTSSAPQPTSARDGYHFTSPRGLHYKDGKLLVVDSGNNRVLVYTAPNLLPATLGQFKTLPVTVLGQDNLGAATSEPSNKRLHLSQNALFLGGTTYLVADSYNNRIVEITGNLFQKVWGQNTLVNVGANRGPRADGLNLPAGIAIAAGKLFVVDRMNNRVVGFNSPDQLVNGQSANFVWGQSSLTANEFDPEGPPSSSSLYNPSSASADKKRLYVCDTNNNRVLWWNLETGDFSNDRPADGVIGQPNATTRNSGASNLSGPNSVYTDGKRLYVADTKHHRVLLWKINEPGFGNISSATILGQGNATGVSTNRGGGAAAPGQSTLYSPQAVYSDGLSLFVGDTYNDRVLVWNDVEQITTGRNADSVIGQVNFTTNTPCANTSEISPQSACLSRPSSIVGDGKRLFVGQYVYKANEPLDYGRVLAWTLPINSNNQNPEKVLWHGNSPTSTTLSDGYIRGLVLNGPDLWVSDEGAHRVVRFSDTSPYVQVNVSTRSVPEIVHQSTVVAALDISLSKTAGWNSLAVRQEGGTVGDIDQAILCEKNMGVSECLSNPLALLLPVSGYPKLFKAATFNRPPPQDVSLLYRLSPTAKEGLVGLTLFVNNSFVGLDDNVAIENGSARTSGLTLVRTPLIDDVGYNHFGIVSESSSTLHLIYRKGTTHTELGTAVHRSSVDGGEKWSEGTEFLPSMDNDVRVGCIGTTPTGRIIVVYSRKTTTQNWLSVYSDDKGLTWSNEVSFSTAPPTQGLPYGRLLALPGNKLLVTGYVAGNKQFSLAHWFSVDDGVTWVRGADVLTYYSDSGHLFDEHSVIPVTTSTWLAVSRGQNSLVFYKTTDSGASWTTIGEMVDRMYPNVAHNKLVAPMLDIIPGESTNSPPYVLLTYANRETNESYYRIGRTEQFIDPNQPQGRVGWGPEHAYAQNFKQMWPSGYQSGIFLNNDPKRYLLIDYDHRGDFQSVVRQFTLDFSDPGLYSEIPEPSSDLTGPAVPQNLQFVEATTGTVKLKWSAATEDLLRYGVDISSNATFTKVLKGWRDHSTPDFNLPSATVEGLTPNTTYYARVRAYDTVGNVSLDSPTLMVTTDPMLTIAITTPAPNTIWTMEQTVSIQAQAEPAAKLTKVWFILDGVTVSTATTAPYSYNWPVTSVINGTHTWEATVFDTLGNSSTTVGIPVTVDIDVTKPTVSLTAPIAGTTYTTPQSVAITATATDNVAVTTVCFILNGVVVSTVTAEPYTYSWPITGANNGAYTWKATAFDAMANSSTTVGVPITVDIDVTKPTVALTAPIAGTTYTTPQSVAITATATDNMAVSTVWFILNGVVVSTDTAEPYAYIWPITGANNGVHTWKATAFDALANSSTTMGVPITVDIDATQPTVALTAPVPGTTFTTPQSVAITANATDNVEVAKIWFILDGVTLSTVTAKPYSYDWPVTSANNGLHTWQATVFDAMGNSSTTVAVPVTVDIDVTKPTVALTAPAAGTTYTTPQSVDITANATDNVAVTTVWFILNGVVVSTDTAAPYAYSWPITGANNGTYSWTATAFDAMANSSTTVGVPVTVNIDVLPPSTPVLLAPTEISSTTVRLNWSAATDNVGVTGYRLYRGTSPIATISGGETTYLDTGLLPATRYKFTVSAFDARGNASALSPELPVTTKRKPLLTPRGSLSGVSSQTVGIRWPAVEGANRYTLAASVSETSETEFAVQREIQQSESSDIESISGLLPNTTYYLYLNACDESQCTEFTPVGSVVTHALAPLLTSAEGKGKEVRLTINGNGNPVGTKYRIEMSRGGGEFTLATTGTSLSPVVGDLTPGERYTFRVKAENHAGVTTEPSSTLNAALAPGNVEGARAYPVPFRPGSGAAGITFDKMPEGATVKIYTVDGRPVKTLTADTDGMALWTLDNDDGSSVVSGVYMAMIEKDGTRKKLKVVVQK